MENIRHRLRAAEQASQRAKDELDEARDNRSYLTAKLDNYEERLRAAGLQKYRGRDYHRLRRKCDDLNESLADGRARVRRAVDSYAISEQNLDLLDLLIDAEVPPSSRHFEEEEPLRRESTRSPKYQTRTTYRYASEDEDAKYSNERSRSYYTTEEHVPSSQRHHRGDHSPSHGYRDTVYETTEEDYSYDTDSSDYATEEHIPRSEYRRHDQPSSHSHYRTEEHRPQTEYRPNDDDRSQQDSRRTENGPSHHPGRSTPRTQQNNRDESTQDHSSRSVPPRQQNASYQPTRTPSQQTVDSWYKYVNHCFLDYSKLQQFPIPPALSCGKPDCNATISNRPFAACECNIRISFGMIPDLNLKRERLRWHPDKFNACTTNLQENFKKMASEVFIVLDKMYKEKQ